MPRRWPPPEVRFWSKVQKSDDCWVWDGRKSAKGYGLMKIDGRDKLTHRFSWELHRGVVPEGLGVLHHCDVRLCVRPDHLFLGTNLDNNRDMHAKGRYVGARRGEHNHNAKLTSIQVRAIRAAYAEGTPQRQLVHQYGVSPHVIHRIVHGYGWVYG